MLIWCLTIIYAGSFKMLGGRPERALLENLFIGVGNHTVLYTKKHTGSIIN
jgi:hypothetical protein